MTAASSETTAGWGLDSARLPERLDGWRVLEVGPGRSEDFFSARGVAEFVACERPAEALLEGGGGFQLVHLAAGLETELHPLAVGAWLWWLAAPEGALILRAQVLADPARSQYAEFLPLPAGSGERWRWLPGRLTLRWMVENSGFDVERWLGEHPAAEPGEVSVYLQAKRVDRVPALDLTRQPLAR